MLKKYVQLINDLARSGREVIRSYDANFLERLTIDVAHDHFIASLKAFSLVYNEDRETFYEQMKLRFKDLSVDVLRLLQSADSYIAFDGKEITPDNYPTIFAIFKTTIVILDNLSRDYWLATAEVLKSTERNSNSLQKYLKNRGNKSYFALDNETLATLDKEGADYNLVPDHFIEEVVNVNIFMGYIKFNEKYRDESKAMDLKPEDIKEFMYYTLNGLAISFAYLVYIDAQLSQYTGNFAEEISGA